MKETTFFQNTPEIDYLGLDFEGNPKYANLTRTDTFMRRACEGCGSSLGEPDKFIGSFRW